MTTKTIAATYVTSLLAVAALLVAASTAFAAEETYLYVNTSGQLEAEKSESPNAALTEAADIKSNSGVILASEYYKMAGDAKVNDTMDDEVVAGSNEIYMYIDTNGDKKFITASSPTQAMNEPTDIKYNSGVQLVVE